MKFRKENPGESGAETRDEMRELAEQISLYRSAMRHVAEKQAERPFVRTAQKTSGFRMRLVLVPALGAAMAAAVIAPTLVHMHHPAIASVTVTPIAPPVNAATQPASVDDTDLMNQIDSEVSEDVPDALQPLEDMSDQATATATKVTENNAHATQK